MNYRRSLVLLVALLIVVVVASCVQSPAPTPAPAATTAPAAETPNAPAASPAPAATGVAAPTIALQDRATVPAPTGDDSRPLAKLSPAERADRFSGPAPMSIVTGTIYVATIVTDKGNIVTELYGDTPAGTNNFVTLAQNGYYDGLTFHRVEPGFVIQGGDPVGTGEGGPGYTIPAEIKHTHPRGALAWARTGDQVNPDRVSSGSQFYITLAETPFLDGGYSVFGQVIEGMDVVDKIAMGDKIQRIDISKAEVSLVPTPAPTPLPVAPVPAEGRPLASKPITDRTGLYNTPPTLVIDPKKTYQATISSAKGDIVLDLDAANATNSVNNFVLLADLGFFDGMPVAFAQPGAYVVLGSPQARPDSDVGYKLDLEENAPTAKVITGTVAYYPSTNQANGQILASGSQFFIALAATPAEAQPTPLNVFGKLSSGQDVVMKLEAGDVITSIKITEK